MPVWHVQVLSFLLLFFFSFLFHFSLVLKQGFWRTKWASGAWTNPSVLSLTGGVVGGPALQGAVSVLQWRLVFLHQCPSSC